MPQPSPTSIPPAAQQMLRAAVQQHQAGNLAEAERGYRDVLAIAPGHADAIQLLGVICSQTGRMPEAIELISRAIAIAPEMPDWHSNLGNALRAMGRTDEAVTAFERSLSLRPNHPVVHFNLANALVAQKRLDSALSHYREALRLKPDYPEAHNNLGLALKDRDPAQAMQCYRNAIRAQPQYADAWDNLLLGLHYFVYEPAAVFAEHVRWAQVQAAAIEQQSRRVRHDNDRDPERRLRVGYISADLRTHSIATFARPIFANHDHERFEIVGFDNSKSPDAITEQFRAMSDKWFRIAGAPDAAVAELVRRERIDVLVDLNAHSPPGRLLVLARRPAPVQVVYLGYPDTSGLRSVDYWITDAHNDPPGQSEALCTEQIVRLPEVFACYEPPADAPEVIEAPPSARGAGAGAGTDARASVAASTGAGLGAGAGAATRAGASAAASAGASASVGAGTGADAAFVAGVRRVTFGSFNNLLKLNDDVIALWSRVLRAVENSRLLMQADGLEDAVARQLLLKRFARHGVAADRVELMPRQPMREHLATITDRADVCLDPFPFTGHTVSLHTLWMGVPFVTLAGRTHVSRRGLGLLTVLGLTDLMATSEDDYVRIAAALATDVPRLTELRRTLRDRMRASPLMDGLRFTRNLEAAYRTMWRRWCESRP